MTRSRWRLSRGGGRSWWRDLPKGRLSLATLFVGIVGWLVVAVGMASVLRSGRPDRALAFAPWDARPQGRAAERAISEGKLSPSTLRSAGGLARSALRRDPTLVPAWRLLGLTETAEKRERVAAGLFRMSERLSRRDLPTQLWLIEDRVKHEDIAGALHHYDVALRTSPKGHDTLLPILVLAAGDPKTALPLGRLLATRPLWSGNYYYRLAQAPAATAPDPATVARMLGLARRGGPLANQEMLGQLLGGMVERGAYGPALSLFTTLSGQAATLPKGVRNGSFEATNPYPPIDWSLASDIGLGAEIRSGVGGRGGALVAYASADRNGVVARQITMLAAGAYRFAFAAGRGQATAPSRLQWRMACAGADGVVPLDHAVDPSAKAPPRATTFRVPAGCLAQWLSLEVGATDPEGSEAWVDDIVVTRIGD